jgi:hypothetical protein
MSVLDFTADKHLDLILSYWALGLTTEQMTPLINAKMGLTLTEAQVAKTLSKFRDQLALETEIRLSTGF